MASGFGGLYRAYERIERKEATMTMTRSKKLARKLKVNRTPTSATAFCDASAKVLALECWRIRKLIPEFEGNRKRLVLETSVDKMTDALTALGVAIEDPEGSEFKDGMTLNVALFDHSDRLESGRRMVSETLSPTIYINNKLVNAARVIVSLGTKDGSHGTQND
jgi:hypothetical protein